MEYEAHLREWVPFPIDFGTERHGVQGRWRFYGVKDPRIDELHPSKRMATIAEEPNHSANTYGAIEEGQSQATFSEQTLGLDGLIPDRDVPVGTPIASSAAAAGGTIGGGLPAAQPGAVAHAATLDFRPATATPAPPATLPMEDFARAASAPAPRTAPAAAPWRC